MYALVVAKGGPKMHAVEGDGPGSLKGVKLIMNAQKTSMPELADLLTGPLQSPVVDATGLKRRFDFVIDLTGYVPGEGAGDGSKEASRQGIDPTTILMSVLPEQIGLKLEARKGPVEILVIDHAEKVPTEN